MRQLITLESISKVLTIVSLCIATIAAWIALPMDAEIKKLQAQTQQLDLDLRAAEAKLREAESTRKLSFDLYQEVKNVLAKKQRIPREEEALRVLVETLADDPFRYKLLSVLAVSATTPEQKRSASESSMFYRDQAQLATRKQPTSTQKNAPPNKPTELGSFDIDIFYCASKQLSSEPIARKVLSMKARGESGRWRLRSLPESVNQQPGYGVTSNEIRYNAPGELKTAKILSERMKKLGIKSRLRESEQSTKWYVSIFICE